VEGGRSRLHSPGRFCSGGGEDGQQEADLLSIAVLAAAGVAGIVVGLRYRASALLGASAAAAAAGALRGLEGQWPGGAVVLFAAACVVLLQLGYLAALFAGTARRR
jgi:hypothetical protein